MGSETFEGIFQGHRKLKYVTFSRKRQYLMIRWLDIHQTCTNIPFDNSKKILCSGDLDLIIKVISLDVKFSLKGDVWYCIYSAIQGVSNKSGPFLKML